MFESMRRNFSALPLFVLAFMAPLANAFSPTSDGLFAVFSTTAGEFTAELDYEAAPMTVANFVRLAEGTIPTMDLSNGDVENRPFYDGITFHRVSPGFVIQGGSPNGLGTDGPGYAFPDEFAPGKSHNAAGVLSMANSGPNSNGSQFFVTLGRATNLDWRHSVFGSVVEGLSVVTAIGSADLVPGTETPVAPVVINGIEIVRQGAAAEAWDESAQLLPVMSYQPMTIEPAAEADKVELFFLRRPFSRNYLSSTTSLSGWNLLGSRGETTAAAKTESFIRSNSGELGRRLYRMIEDQKVLPVSRPGLTLRFFPPSDLPSYSVTLGADFDGTYTHVDTGGTTRQGSITYRWYEQATVDVLNIIFDLNLITYRNSAGQIVYVPNQPQQLSLFFNSAISGTFSVHYYRPNSSWDAYPDLVLQGGTFILTGL
jgi:cyclophilin family peptidyl-prolyl cis-trans isomerase